MPDIDFFAPQVLAKKRMLFLLEADTGVVLDADFSTPQVLLFC